MRAHMRVFIYNVEIRNLLVFCLFLGKRLKSRKNLENAGFFEKTLKKRVNYNLQYAFLTLN